MNDTEKEIVKDTEKEKEIAKETVKEKETKKETERDRKRDRERDRKTGREQTEGQTNGNKQKAQIATEVQINGQSETETDHIETLTDRLAKKEIKRCELVNCRGSTNSDLFSLSRNE